MTINTTAAGTSSVAEVTLTPDNSNVVSFANGNQCQLSNGTCSVTIKNINTDGATVPVTFTATATNANSASVVINFSGAPSGDIILSSLTGATATLTVGHAYTNTTFTFVNNSGNTLDNVKAVPDVSSAMGAAPNTSFISNIVNNCNVSSLASGATCTITATLDPTTNLSTSTFAVNFAYTVDGKSFTADYDKTFTAITNTDTSNQTVAVRVINRSTTSDLYVVVETNKYNGSGQAQTSYLIPLTADSALSSSTVTVYNGASSGTGYHECANTTCTYSTDSIKIPHINQGTQYSAVLLLPAGDLTINSNGDVGISGEIYLSLDASLANGAAPSVTNINDPNYNTRWAQFEYTSSGNTAKSEASKFTVDLTNVDFVSLPLVFETLQDASGQPIVNGDVHYNPNMTSGIKPAYNGQSIDQILGGIETTLEASPNASDSWSKLIEKNTSENITRVISPNIGNGVTQFQMPTDYFSTYSQDLWNYYKTHTLLVDVSSLPNCSGLILQGTVTQSGDVYTFAFTPYNSVPASCTTSSGSITGITNNASGLPNNYDFFGGAGDSSNAVTWGATNTVRAVVGEAIVAAQSVGLMPYPDGETLSSANVRGKTYYADTQTNFLESQSGHTYSHTMYNVYSAAVAQYFNNYNYPYGDFLGADGTVADTNVQLAPVTITLAG